MSVTVVADTLWLNRSKWSLRLDIVEWRMVARCRTLCCQLMDVSSVMGILYIQEIVVVMNLRVTLFFAEV